MAAFALIRLAKAVPVLLGVSLAVFLMLHALPVDPIRMLAMDSMTGTAPTTGVNNAQYNSLKHQLGLDRSLPEQFGLFLWRAVHGDFGTSFRNNRPVSAMLFEQFPYTIRLTVAGLALAVATGLVLGIAAALAPNSYIDTVSMGLAVLGVSMPVFWLGLMLLYVFSLWLGVIPAASTGPVSIVLPAVALGFQGSAIIARLMRASLVEVMQSDYVCTARAKGLAERFVVLRHALRNALVPVVTVVGLQFGSLLSGAVVVETVFARPGIGTLAVQGVVQHDFPLVQGFVLIAGVAYTLANIFVDLVYGALDPRIRFG
jgi:peptide/nickel transport system permease protein/oligopeptide transport system permease protein